MAQKTCQKCGKLGHNARTCGKEKVAYQPTFQRQCGICQGFGHNARTCTGTPQVETVKRDTLLEVGRQLLAQEAVKVERIEVDGVTPQRGLWLVNTEKKRCAGLISMVRKSGEIVWKDFDGTLIESAQTRLVDSGYKYLADKPVGSEWSYLHLCAWSESPIMRETLENPDGL